MIRAECYSDDRVITVNFDATRWFKKATDAELFALANCSWKGDYPADDVAVYVSTYDEELMDVFKYIEIVNDHRASSAEMIGFECVVNEEDALEWIRANKPYLRLMIKNMQHV